jgi:hypothetical protein
LRGRQGKYRREHLGLGARHDCIDSHRLHGVFPRFALAGHSHTADDLIRRMVGLFEHRSDALLSGHDDGELVRPESIVEVTLKVFCSVRADQPFFLSLHKTGLALFVIQWSGEMANDLFH